MNYPDLSESLCLVDIQQSDSDRSWRANFGSDSWITTKVKSALLADSLTKGLKISVKTTHHVVSLTRMVETQAAIDQAIHLTAQIKEVKSVDASGLKLGKD